MQVLGGGPTTEYGPAAWMVEHLHDAQKDVGSSPTRVTRAMGMVPRFLHTEVDRVRFSASLPMHHPGGRTPPS